jgi:hypothetical protein
MCSTKYYGIFARNIMTMKKKQNKLRTGYMKKTKTAKPNKQAC